MTEWLIWSDPHPVYMPHPVSKWPTRHLSHSLYLYPGYKCGLRNVQHRFSLELSHYSNSVSHSFFFFLLLLFFNLFILSLKVIALQNFSWQKFLTENSCFLFHVKAQHESAIAIHISPPFWTSLPTPSQSHPCWCRAPVWISWAIQQFPLDYLFYIW